MQKVNARVLLAGLFVVCYVTLKSFPHDQYPRLSTSAIIGRTLSGHEEPLTRVSVPGNRKPHQSLETPNLTLPVFHLNPEFNRYVARVGLVDMRRLKPLPPVELRRIDMETLWLARGIFSETIRPEEQELVAWVIRNRVETRYRGKSTYRDVVLDPYQFSAFNPDYPDRRFIRRLDPTQKIRGWQTALAIAHEVRYLSSRYRPFSLTTRHFYSERSLNGLDHPNWIAEGQPVKPLRPYGINHRRFRFYDGVN